MTMRMGLFGVGVRDVGSFADRLGSTDTVLGYAFAAMTGTGTSADMFRPFGSDDVVTAGSWWRMTDGRANATVIGPWCLWDGPTTRQERTNFYANSSCVGLTTGNMQPESTSRNLVVNYSTCVDLAQMHEVTRAAVIVRQLSTGIGE